VAGRRFAAAGVTILVLLAFAAAGCGGSKAPSVASLGTTTSSGEGSTTTAAKPSTAALATCLSAHGIQASVGSGGGGKEITFGGVTISGNVDPTSPQFQAAAQACRKYLPGGGPPALTPAQQAEHAKAMASFAACMRKHGVPGFPDPNPQGFFPPAGLQGLDPSSSFFQSAFKVCGPLQGKIGPRIEFGP